jgi:hypothetical protein
MIFNTGGVAAFVGNTYGAAKDVGVYVTGEAIRGLADLEAKERERCANFAPKQWPLDWLSVRFGSPSGRASCLPRSSVGSQTSSGYLPSRSNLLRKSFAAI